jgi:hypothetical protein
LTDGIGPIAKAMRFIFYIISNLRRRKMGYGASCGGYGGAFTSVGIILVLFILLVIISRAIVL